MTKYQFGEIEFFTADECQRTGADVAAIQYPLMLALDRFRKLVGCKVFILKNGLTSGNHRSKAHALGMAVDVTVEHERTPQEIFKIAMKCGFDAVGVYHNTRAYSYHLGIHGMLSLWSATPYPDGSWKYGPLIVDPKASQ